MNLSIIIPHFNSPKLLEKLLLSIPQLKEIQVIVVDDNSTKDLDSYENLQRSQRFSSVVFLKNNSRTKGAGVCRNIGLSFAKGDWVLFADADDYFIGGFYEIIEKYFTSSNDIVFFMPTSIELDTGKPSDRHRGYKKIILDYLNTKDSTSLLHLRYRFTVPWSKLFRREFLIKNHISFDETIASNDMMFSSKAGYHMKTFEVSKEVIYCVTRSKGTLTRNMDKKIFDARLGVFIRTHQYLKARLVPEELEKLNLIGRGYVNKAFRYNLGLKETLKTYRILRKHGIQIFEWKLLRPSYIIKKMKERKKFNKKEEKYFIK